MSLLRLSCCAIAAAVFLAAPKSHAQTTRPADSANTPHNSPATQGPVDVTPAPSPSTAPATKAEMELEKRTAAVAATLRCPVCQGESIQDSPAELAQQMRGVVREQLRAGRTPAEVQAYFVSRYGEWILLEPKMTGLNVLLYAFPVVLVLGGLAFVIHLVRRWTGRDSRSATPTEQA